MDIDMLVPFIAEYEQKIKQQRHSKRSSNAKENEDLQNVTALNPKPTTEEKVLNEGAAVKCVEEDFLVPSIILVDEENLLNDVKTSEYMSESDCCKNVLEKKIEFKKEVEIESIECLKNDECEREFEKEKDVDIIECFQIQRSEKESKELSEKNYQKSCEKRELERNCEDVSLIAANYDHNPFSCEPIALQVILDLSPKKPPDKCFEPVSPLSGIEQHCASLNLDSRTNPFEESGNDTIQIQEIISSNSINNSSIPSDSLLIPRVGAKRIEEAINERGENGGLDGVQQGTHVGIQRGIIREEHVLGGTYKEPDDVYTQGALKKAQDPYHHILGPITRSSINGDVFERLHKTFGLSFGPLEAQNVSMYVDGAIEPIIMSIQACMHAFGAHVRLSTWQMIKIHEIGVT